MSFLTETPLPEEEPVPQGPSDIFALVPKSNEPEVARLTYALGAGLGNPSGSGPQDPEDTVNMLMRETRAVMTGQSNTEGPVTQSIRAAAGRREITSRLETIADNFHMIPEGSPLRNEAAYQFKVLSEMAQQSDADISAVSSEIGLVIDRAYIDSGTFLDPDVFSAQFENLQVASATGSLAETARFLAGKADEVSVLDWGLVGNVAMMVIPIASVVEAVNMGLISQDVLPDSEQEWTDFLFAGSAKEKIALALANASPEQRIEYNTKIKDAIEKYNGARLLGMAGNDLEKWGVYGEIQDNIEELLQNDTSVDWTKGLDNVASATSFIPVAGGVVAGLVKGGKVINRAWKPSQYKGSFNLHVARNMEDGDKIVSEIIREGSKEALAALGTTREDALLAVLPKPRITEDGVAARTLSDITAANIEASTLYAEDAILQPLTRSAAGVEMSADFLKQNFQGTISKQVGTHVNMSLSQIGDIDEASETFVLKSFIGVDKNNGFTQLGNAVEAKLMYQLPDDTEVWKYDAGIDSYRRMTDAEWASSTPRDTGEFYLVQNQRVGMGKDYIASLADMRRKGASALGTGNWTVSPLTRYGNDLRTVLNVAVSGEAAEVERFRRVAKPYHDLSHGDRAIVDTLLHSYDGKARLSADELLAPIAIDGPGGRDMRLLSEAQIAGYVSYQNTMDSSWARLNQAERTRMFSEGLRWVYDSAHGVSMPARQIIDGGAASREIGSGKWVFDPQVGKAVKMTAEDIERLYGSVGQLAKLDKPMVTRNIEDTGVEVRYIAVRPGSSTSVTDLPMEVVRRTPGYTPRIWTAPWIVTRPNAATGDVDYVAMGHDYKEVSRWLEEYKGKSSAEQTNGMEVIANPALVNNQLTRREFEVENLMFYQDRSADVTQIGAKEIRESPAASMNRMTSAIAQHVMTGRVLEKMEHQFVKEFGKHFEGGLSALPTSRGDLRKLFKGSDMQVFNEAQAMYDWLAVMNREKGALQTTIDNIIARGIGESLAKFQLGNSVADYLSGKPVRMAGSALMVNDVDPIKFARTTAFVTQILMNPIKQIIVNSPQLALFSTKNPKNAARALGVDATYLSVMFHAEKQGIKANQNAILKAVLKSDDALQTKDMKALAKAFKESGLGEIQELHTATENTMEWLRTSALRGMGELGFAAGERFNLAAAFSFSARNLADELEKPLADFGKREWEQVISNARQYTGNMTRADSYSYQHGAFSGLMQYMAIRHKMLNMMTHGDQLTGGEKAASLGLMAALYGANGVGVAFTVTEMMARLGVDYGTLAEELNKSEVVPGDQWDGDTVKMVIEGGLVDLAHNKFFDEILDESESSNVEVSAAVSPFAGLDKSTIGVATVIAEGGNIGSVVDFLAGPSGHFFGKAYNLYTTASKMFTYDSTEINEDRAASLGRQMLALSAGGSNVLRAYIGSATGSYLNGYLTPTAEATAYELLALGVAGLQSTEAREMYDFRQLAGYDPKATPDALRSDINELVNHLVYVTQMAESPEDLAERIAGAHVVFEGIKRQGTHSSLFVDNVKKEYFRKLGKMDEPMNKRMYDHILERATSGVSVKAVDEPAVLLKRMLNTTYFQERPEQAQVLRDAINMVEEQGRGY